MKKTLILLFSLLVVFAGGVFLFLRRTPPLETKFVQPDIVEAPDASESAGFEEISDAENTNVRLRRPGDSALLSAPRQVYQTFNNCGPATLSMALSWYGISVSQEELAQKMRPYQVANGDNDDKTIFTQEFAQRAEAYGLKTVNRVNGTIDLLKLFTANDIPVVVKTWLKPGEDIGHFRFVRGFDEAKQVVIVDDSYHGPNRRVSYYDFLSMWQPFNYAYIILYPAEKEELVRTILGGEGDESVAWKGALERAKEEEKLDSQNIYPVFNQATAHFHLGEDKESVSDFERVEERLPRRMLWYQIEPILAYQKLDDFERVISMTDKILENGNRAFSELYQIRGEMYLDRGDREKAREQFELAIKYNSHFEPARTSLEGLLAQ